MIANIDRDRHCAVEHLINLGNIYGCILGLLGLMIMITTVIRRDKIKITNGFF